MAKTEWTLIAANMGKNRGKHWIDRENKTRYMEIYGVVFVWDPTSETWRFAEEG